MHKRLTYSIDEAAAMLHISQHKLYDLIHNKKISAFKIRYSLRIPFEEINRLLTDKDYNNGKNESFKN